MKKLLLKALVITTLGIGVTRSSNGQVTDYNLFKEDFLTQTAPSTVSSDDWAATSNLVVTDSSDASSVTITTPSQTNNMPATSPTSYAYRVNASTKAEMDASAPSNAAYNFTITGGSLGTDSGVLNFPAEGKSAGQLSYPSAIPLISNYTAVQNLNTTQAATFDFSGFTDISGSAPGGPNQYMSYLFFDVFNSSGTVVFSDDFQSASTTDVTIPAGTLLPDADYTVSLDYSNREVTTDVGFTTSSGGVSPLAGLDYSTATNIHTAAVVPEPSTYWMVVGGLGVLVVGRRVLRRA
jgi:hypothetical protein